MVLTKVMCRQDPLQTVMASSLEPKVNKLCSLECSDTQLLINPIGVQQRQLPARLWSPALPTAFPLISVGVGTAGCRVFTRCSSAFRPALLAHRCLVGCDCHQPRRLLGRTHRSTSCRLSGVASADTSVRSTRPDSPTPESLQLRRTHHGRHQRLLGSGSLHAAGNQRLSRNQ
ncbi:hypothetical protein NDU88_004211 [Pleurodeles waltl]|uniref:Uncharacterized protein n=1 Tax=Pleurodeles waltl TaxID=8319 RepID=A0AAV7V2C5_PLEWA|nr:hypothetical protein NDU88_004211 [Pleurodeles waltl]